MCPRILVGSPPAKYQLEDKEEDGNRALRGILEK
jgi:hypothetical protein